jgi:hypothetical protein
MSFCADARTVNERNRGKTQSGSSRAYDDYRGYGIAWIPALFYRKIVESSADVPGSEPSPISFRAIG